MIKHVDWKQVVFYAVMVGALGWFVGTVADFPPVLSVMVGAAGASFVIAVRTSTSGKTRHDALSNKKSGSYFGVVFDETSVTHLDERQPINGVNAAVETAGALSRYPDVANMVIGGALFGRLGAVLAANDKKVDDRELYLSIRGTEHHWVVKLDPRQGDLARQFAARVNSVALAAQKAESVVRADPTEAPRMPEPQFAMVDPIPAAPTTSTNIAEQIRQLKDLSDAGVISTVEFEAAKRRLLR